MDPDIMGTKNSPFNFGLPRYACVAVGIAATKSSSFSGILKRSGDQVDHFPVAFRPVSPPHTNKQRQLLLRFP
jgi:DNA gyrase inhibitor GyrI